jgi:hypothetical protein
MHDIELFYNRGEFYAQVPGGKEELIHYYSLDEFKIGKFKFYSSLYSEPSEHFVRVSITAILEDGYEELTIYFSRINLSSEDVSNFHSIYRNEVSSCYKAIMEHIGYLAVAANKLME